MLYQKTLKEKAALEGVGLHSGRNARLVLCPAPPDTGLVFLVEGRVIKAVHENVTNTDHATSIGAEGVDVRTVEHLLAALSGLGVDNAYMEITGGEVPAADGSALPFVRLIKEAGLSVQGAGRRFLKVVKPVRVSLGDKSAALLPSPVTRMTYRIDFDDRVVSEQSLSLDLDPASFEAELSRARTFGFLKDVEMLRKAGLARGGSPDNAVVVDDGRIINPEGLRYKDEFVRHKMLDAIGDLALAGMPVIGHLIADKSGHRLNHMLVGELMAHRDSWIVVEGGQAIKDAPQEFAFSEAGA